eukprot:jgi/Bigna1/135121/aug1.28_g9829
MNIITPMLKEEIKVALRRWAGCPSAVAVEAPPSHGFWNLFGLSDDNPNIPVATECIVDEYAAILEETPVALVAGFVLLLLSALCAVAFRCKAKEEAEGLAREEAERKAKEEAKRLAREEAERKAKEEAKRLAREEAERKAKEEAERLAREEAERKAKEEAERLAREEAKRKAKEEAERLAREEAERKAKEEAKRLAREVAECKAKEEAERLAREVAECKAKEETERLAREEAERKAKEEAERLADRDSSGSTMKSLLKFWSKKTLKSEKERRTTLSHSSRKAERKKSVTAKLNSTAPGHLKKEKISQQKLVKKISKRPGAVRVMPALNPKDLSAKLNSLLNKRAN